MSRLATERIMKSITGVEKYDRLAREDADEFQDFLNVLEENGWIVKATSQLPKLTIAEFFPRKGRFYFDPERMTVLDMLHEQHHLERFKQRGNWKTGQGQVWRDELAAYTFEQDLGKREGFSVEYMAFLDRQIEYYEARVSMDTQDHGKE